VQSYRYPGMRGFAALRQVLLLMACASALSTAWALEPADLGNAAREAARLQRDQQQQMQQQFEADRGTSRAPTVLPVPEVKPPSLADKGGCRQIDTIHLAGARQFDSMQRKRLVKPYLGRCLGVADVESLLADITRVYIRRGLIASRAYIPAQDLSQGVLEVLVVEGQVEDLRQEPLPDQEAVSRPLFLGTLFPGVIGEPLNLRDIEQGMDQGNRLASNRITMDVRSGSQPGDSVVAIHNQPGKRWHANVSADNLGSRSTGRNQAALSLSLDSLMGLNDFISVTRRQAMPNHDGEGSSSETYSYVLPYGYATFALGLSNSRYESTLRTAGGLNLQSAGDNQLAFFRGDYVAWRGQTGRLAFSATLTGKENHNYLAGQLLGVSSRRLTILDLGGSFTLGLGRGLVTLDASLSSGLHGLGAMADPQGLPADAPRAQFRKSNYGASYFYPFRFAGMDGSASTQLSGQHSRDALYGSEQISIGGMYSVRGFYDQSLAGDEGYYLRNDLSLQKALGRLQGRPVVLKPYLALDGGDVRSVAQGTPSGTLVGVAIGASLLSGPLFLDVLVGHPLHQSDALPDERGSNAALRFSCLF
jgi:hemolysin activation/secretion protein